MATKPKTPKPESAETVEALLAKKEEERTAKAEARKFVLLEERTRKALAETVEKLVHIDRKATLDKAQALAALVDKFPKLSHQTIATAWSVMADQAGQPTVSASTVTNLLAVAVACTNTQAEPEAVLRKLQATKSNGGLSVSEVKALTPEIVKTLGLDVVPPRKTRKPSPKKVSPADKPVESVKALRTVISKAPRLATATRSALIAELAKWIKELEASA